MISLIGAKEVIRGLCGLAKPFVEIEDKLQKCDTEKIIREGYLKFLDQYQPEVPKNRSSFLYVKDPAIIENYVKQFKVESHLDDREQSGMLSHAYDNTEQESRTVICEEALNFLQKVYPELSQILKFSIHSVFFYYSADCGGGSTSNAIGVIWINNKKSWDKYDIAELLVHELTHHLVFLDELRYLHYLDYDLILKPENYTKSAILSSRRPIDKVIHSIIVGVEVLCYRMNVAGVPAATRVHPPSPKLLKQLEEALYQIRALPNLNDLITARTHDLLRITEARLDEARRFFRSSGLQKNLKAS